MKKLLTGVAALAVLPAAAAAQPDSAELNMAAVISERCEVNLVGTNPNILFSLDQTVANIDTVCNLPGTINLRLTSDNGGQLVNSAAGGGVVNYTVDVLPNNVGPADISGVGDNLSIAQPIDLFANGADLLDGAQVDLRVDIQTGPTNNGDVRFAGSYEDTITVEIGADGTF